MSDPTPLAPRTTLAHLSDIHFGRIADERIVAALVAEVNGAGHDLVVVSGDLTQRARTREFRAARAMLDAFEPPTVVVPGNHDVRAWWHNPFERVWRSSKRFREHISPERTPSFEAPGLSVFGLNSAHGLTIKGGKIREADVEAMAAYFASRPAEDFRVLTLHHHLLLLEDLGGHDVSRGARRALDVARRADVDLVLCGHLHRSHVAPVELEQDRDRHRIVIASAGTATSNRGRGDDRAANFYNVVTVEEGAFTVSERRFDTDAGAFAEERATTFDRVP